jgi:hypothetical protein
MRELQLVLFRDRLCALLSFRGSFGALADFFHLIAEFSTKPALLPPYACLPPKLLVLVVAIDRFVPEALQNFKLHLKIKEREYKCSNLARYVLT